VNQHNSAGSTLSRPGSSPHDDKAATTTLTAFPTFAQGGVAHRLREDSQKSVANPPPP
jgi:hypothetical protein